MCSVHFLLAIVFCLCLANALQDVSNFNERNLCSQGRSPSGSTQPNPQASGMRGMPSQGFTHHGKNYGSPCRMQTGLHSRNQPLQPDSVRSTQPNSRNPGMSQPATPVIGATSGNPGSVLSRQRRQMGTGNSGSMASSFSNGAGMGYPMMGMGGMGMHPGMWG